MEASVSGNVPVVQNADKTSEMRLVATYNMSPLGAGAREAYVRLKSGTDESPTFISVGRFNVPFGLLTDEHRTYTRLQTNMTLNNFSNGAAVSGNFSKLYYDFALVDDFQGTGNFTMGDVTYGAVLNLRWAPATLPFFVGASQNFEYSQVQPEPYATSVYTALSFDRLTSDAIPGSFIFEAVSARNWNSSTLNSGLSTFFIPSTDSAYLASIASSQSLGFYTQVKWDINNRWSIFYKFDSLELSSQFTGDAFLRSGLGFEVFINSNLILNTRAEYSTVTRSEIQSSGVLAAQSDFLAMLRLWL